MPDVAGVVKVGGARPSSGVRIPLWAILLVGMLSFLVRAWMVLRWDFPLNDGGLYVEMIEAIRRAGYALPHYASYNGVDIPFAYPPATFYLAALFSDLTHISPTRTLQLIPLTMSIGSVLSFCWLANTVLQSRVAIITASLLVAFLPSGFIGLIMGSGLTRSVAFMAAIAALRQAYVMYRHPSTLTTMGLVACVTLTLISHLEIAWYLAFSLAGMWLAFGRTRPGVKGSCIVGTMAVLLTAPWWMVVLMRHGAAPFLAASQTGSALATLSAPGAATLGDLAIFLALTITTGVAALLMIVTRDFRLLMIGWMILTAILDSRGVLWLATVPLALLLGAGLGTAVFHLKSMLQVRPIGSGSAVNSRLSIRRHTLYLNLLTLALVLPLAGYLIAASGSSPLYNLVLSVEERQAMEWIKSTIPPDGSFLLVTGEYWSADPASEWFPVIAQHVSIATPQGFEWLPDRRFFNQVQIHGAAQRCATSDSDCLDRWQQESGLTFDFIYLGRGRDHDCCSPLRSSLILNPDYAVIYESVGAVIFRPQNRHSLN
jgi:hypothetical protein